MELEIAKYFWSLKHTFIYSISNVVSGKVYIILTSLLFVFYALYKLKKNFMLFLIIAVISVSVSDLICYRVLKPLIKRARPSVELKKSDQKEILIPIRPLEKKHYSMPSNHASNIFAFFTVYFLFVRKYWSFLLLNSVIIAFSRITLVKHYPTDVLAGIAVGIVTGLLTYSLFSLLDNRFGFREKLETS